MDYHKVDLQGYEAQLPILPLPSGIKIAFFNLNLILRHMIPP